MLITEEEEVEDEDEAMDLLEEWWFYENLLKNKRETRMLKCHSDPYPSKTTQEMLVNMINSAPDHHQNSCSSQKEEKESNLSLRKFTRTSSDHNLCQTPVQLSSKGKRLEGTDQGNGSGGDMRSTKLTGKPALRSLLRTPSLPPHIGREAEDQMSSSGMGKLSRRSPSEFFPTRHEGMAQSLSIPRYRPPKGVMRTRKGTSDLEHEEVQGFKDLGFTFDQEYLTPSVVKIIPGLREKEQDNPGPNKVKRPYLSEAWLAQSCPPPIIPNWASKTSSSPEDMKAQIKFWARAVASNVHQEC